GLSAVVAERLRAKNGVVSCVCAEGSGSTDLELVFAPEAIALADVLRLLLFNNVEILRCTVKERSLEETFRAVFDSPWAQQRAGAGRFLVGRVEHLPYRDGVFDVCVANSILEHAQDWAATLREITRVLKVGGLLVFYTTNRVHPFQTEINGFPFYPWIPQPLK